MKTLEEDILAVIYTSWRSLSLEDIWEALSERGICVPILYLEKVIRTLNAAGYIMKEKGERDVSYYRVKDFWDRFKPFMLVQLTRQVVKTSRMGSITKANIIVALMLGSLSLGLPVMAESTEYVTPITLESVELSQDTGSTKPAALTPQEEEAEQITAVGTSRPSFTDAWITVPGGSLQAENGATYTDFSGKTKAWTVPETLLRLGITDNTELRFTVPNYIYAWEDGGDSLINNFGDISVGLSHHVALPGKFDLAIIPILNIPSGANKASTNSVDPQLRLSVGRAITPKLTLGSHLDTRWNTGKNALADVVFNATGIAYYAFTGKLSGFLEYSGFIPTSGKTSQFLQWGALYLPTPRQQLDVRMAVGLNKNSPDILVGFGYTFRIDGLF